MALVILSLAPPPPSLPLPHRGLAVLKLLASSFRLASPFGLALVASLCDGKPTPGPAQPQAEDHGPGAAPGPPGNTGSIGTADIFIQVTRASDDDPAGSIGSGLIHVVPPSLLHATRLPPRSLWLLWAPGCQAAILPIVASFHNGAVSTNLLPALRIHGCGSDLVLMPHCST